MFFRNCCSHEQEMHACQSADCRGRVIRFRMLKGTNARANNYRARGVQGPSKMVYPPCNVEPSKIVNRKASDNLLRQTWRVGLARPSKRSPGNTRPCQAKGRTMLRFNGRLKAKRGAPLFKLDRRFATFVSTRIAEACHC